MRHRVDMTMVVFLAFPYALTIDGKDTALLQGYSCLVVLSIFSTQRRFYFKNCKLGFFAGLFFWLISLPLALRRDFLAQLHRIFGVIELRFPSKRLETKNQFVQRCDLCRSWGVFRKRSCLSWQSRYNFRVKVRSRTWVAHHRNFEERKIFMPRSIVWVLWFACFVVAFIIGWIVCLLSVFTILHWNARVARFKNGCFSALFIVFTFFKVVVYLKTVSLRGIVISDSSWVFDCIGWFTKELIIVGYLIRSSCHICQWKTTFTWSLVFLISNLNGCFLLASSCVSRAKQTSGWEWNFAVSGWSSVSLTYYNPVSMQHQSRDHARFVRHGILHVSQDLAHSLLCCWFKFW